MSGAVPWPAVGALLSGIISLYFIRYLWPYRDNLGARFFIATIGCEALWALSYGAALLVFDPAIRPLFEVPIWLGINFIGVFFLAFALEYTGRGHLVRSKWMGVIVLIQVLHSAVVVTNPLHGVAWNGYHIEPVLGAATVSYTHQPWLFLNFAGLYLMVAAGSFLLVDTFFSYGSLYRGQAAAIALSPVFPGVAFLLWLFGIGGTFPLNLTPLTFPIHLGFDMYAFFRRNMFEMTPAARRAAERAAIDDLGSAVVVVDDAGRIIDSNEEARRVFAATGGELLSRPVGSFVDGIDLSADEQTVSITTGGERREYAVATSPLADSVGNSVGYTVVLQDITAEKQREQRLMVLNRVLRHNLRNDLTVVRGTVEVAEQRVSDDEIRDVLAKAKTKTGEMIELGEKARTIERLLETGDAASETVRLRELVGEVESDLLPSGTDGTVETDVPDDLRLRSDPELLESVFRNLIENALQHNDADDPLVEVRVVETRGDGRSVTVEIRDNGPGIPDHERAVIEAGEETALEHGSGLGLWLVKWAITSIGGEVRFETDGTGTTVTLRLPRVVEDGEDGDVASPGTGTTATRPDRDDHD